MAENIIMIDPMLKNGDVVLRRFAPGDREALVRLADNPKVSRYLANRFPHPYTADDADAWIALAGGETRLCNFAVEWRGELVGGAGLIPLSDIHSGTAEIGYWLGEPYWGRGIATGAVALLTAYALDELLFIRAQAEVFAENAVSMRVLEKNGFVREGTLRKHIRKDGVIHDAVMYARLRNNG